MRLAKISFRQRFIISNLMLVFILLPVLGFSLFNTFKQQALISEQQNLEAYSYNLLAAADIKNGNLIEPISLDSPNFAIPDSGLYALIRNEQDILWHSKSYIEPVTPIQWPSSEEGQSAVTTLVFNDNEHFNWQLQVVFEQDEKLYPFTFHILKSKQDYYQQVNVFSNTLWKWLALVGIVFAAIQIAWMMWFQKPLQDLSTEVEEVEKGKLSQISNQYPKEILTLINSLNRLIETEAQQRERYKNTLADLAHSLKTPLAVVMSETNIPKEIEPELHKIDAIISHQLKRAQGGHSSWQTGCKLSPIVKNTIKGLSKIYHDKQIQFVQDLSDEVIFYGAETDAYEIVGNLLDNACKACKDKVRISLKEHGNALEMNICDDGPGLNQAQSQAILQRGHRADTYEQGQGIGLAVVTDLVKSYGGKFEIAIKGELGGAQFTVIFNRAITHN